MYLRLKKKKEERCSGVYTGVPKSSQILIMVNDHIESETLVRAGAGLGCLCGTGILEYMNLNYVQAAHFRGCADRGFQKTIMLNIHYAFSEYTFKKQVIEQTEVVLGRVLTDLFPELKYMNFYVFFDNGDVYDVTYSCLDKAEYLAFRRYLNMCRRRDEEE